MADQVHRTLPSVFLRSFYFAHMLPPSVDIHHWGFPPHTAFLSPPRWDLRALWMESFSSHMTLSLSTSCFLLLLSDTLLSQSASVPSARWHKGYIWSMLCSTPSTEHTPQQMALLCWWWVTRQRNQALTPCDGALGARQGCPAVPPWPPYSPFLHSPLYVQAVKFNPLKGRLFAINLGLTSPLG